MNEKRRACLLMGMPFVLSSCLRTGDTIRIDLFVTSKTPLRDVYVIVGVEKYMWPQLAPDERGTFQIHLMEARAAIIRYRLPNGEKAEWTSAKIDPYRVRVVQADLSGNASAPVDAKFIQR